MEAQRKLASSLPQFSQLVSSRVRLRPRFPDYHMRALTLPSPGLPITHATFAALLG